jgi:hypothetical protein
MAQVAMHITHDGFPQPLKALAKQPALAPFAEFVSSTLRRNPRERPEAAVVRKELARIRPSLAQARWPLG